MARLLLLTFSCFVFSMTCGFAKKKGCSPGFIADPVGESCYCAVFKTMSWHDAQSSCQSKKSNLASVTSQKEMEFIWDNVISEVFYHHWIGLYKNDSENETTTAKDGWKWIDGTAYDTSWTIWQAGQPRSHDNYALMYMNFAGDWPHWSGETSGATRHVFICEHEIDNPNKSPVPTMSTSESKTTKTLEESSTVESTGKTSKESSTVESTGKTSKESSTVESTGKTSKESSTVESTGKTSKESSTVESTGKTSKESSTVESTVKTSWTSTEIVPTASTTLATSDPLTLDATSDPLALDTTTLASDPSTVAADVSDESPDVTDESPDPVVDDTTSGTPDDATVAVTTTSE